MKHGDIFTFTYECTVKLCRTAFKKDVIINYIKI